MQRTPCPTAPTGRRVRPRGAVALLALPALLVTGCSMESLTERAVEGVVERATDGEIDVDRDSGQVTITDEEGATATFGQTSEVPDDFTSAVPVAPSFQVLAVTEVTEDGNRALQVSGTVEEGSLESLMSGIDGQLDSAGWQAPEDADGAEGMFSQVAEMETRMRQQGDHVLMVTAISDDVDAGPHQLTYLWIPQGDR